jgi:hypothetical protein
MLVQVILPLKSLSTFAITFWLRTINHPTFFWILRTGMSPTNMALEMRFLPKQRFTAGVGTDEEAGIKF